MWPSLSHHFSSSTPSEIVIVGIESHICVTQTAIDALAAGHKVYILADGIQADRWGSQGYEQGYEEDDGGAA
ncbi:hypothetical protein V495_04462 [Pseudogymnoascus sp. VKM F-4514 (FW-929)]|nr:hypothetical protein V495_04462 [Pseudogymnoascus sp. VKM F-4514 (FW-929)]